MKNLKNIGLILGVFFILSISCFGTEFKQQQTYVSNIIINAPWGVKNVDMDREPSPPGEFGIYDPYTRDPKAFDEGPVMGPSTFTVTPNGDIYIVDTFNHRLQRFTPDGKFVSILPAPGSGWVEDICLDINGNIYLLYLGPAQVWKHDPAGNLLKVISMFNHEDSEAVGMNIGGGSTHLYCDNSGRLFLSYYKMNEKAQAIFQFGTTSSEFTPEEQKATLRRGFTGISGIILNKDQIFQIIDGKFFSVDNSGKPVIEYKSIFGSSYSFLDVDSLDYVYLISYNPEKDIFTIRKQTSEGKFVSSFEWENSGYAQHNLSKPIIVDSKGNIYVFDSSKSGITITKWLPSAAGK